MVLTILDELRKYGKSEALDSLWYQDYNEIPVSIDEFITNPYYLGKSTRNGTSIYPYWRNKYREIFDTSLDYEEIILTGAIGVGKTRTAVVCLAYLLYKIMCLKNPQEYFKFNEGDKITIFFLNINLRLAEGVGYMTLHEYLLNSPWFMERGTLSEEKNPDGTEHIASCELVRLALPRRVFTLSQVRFVADRIAWLYENRHLIGGLKFVEEPAVMRFFIGRLEADGDWQEKLVAKFKEDFGESL